jgi:hypothetical protein
MYPTTISKPVNYAQHMHWLNNKDQDKASFAKLQQRSREKRSLSARHQVARECQQFANDSKGDDDDIGELNHGDSSARKVKSRRGGKKIANKTSMHGRLVKLMDDVLAPNLQLKDEGDGGEQEDGGNEGTVSGKKGVTTRDVHVHLIELMDDVLAPISDNEDGKYDSSEVMASIARVESRRSGKEVVTTRDIHDHLIELMDDVLAPTFNNENWRK